MVRLVVLFQMLIAQVDGLGGIQAQCLAHGIGCGPLLALAFALGFKLALGIVHHLRFAALALCLVENRQNQAVLTHAQLLAGSGLLNRRLRLLHRHLGIGRQVLKPLRVDALGAANDAPMLVFKVGYIAASDNIVLVRAQAVAVHRTLHARVIVDTAVGIERGSWCRVGFQLLRKVLLGFWWLRIC